jgi:hypothetical protein
MRNRAPDVAIRLGAGLYLDERGKQLGSLSSPQKPYITATPRYRPIRTVGRASGTPQREPRGREANNYPV